MKDEIREERKEQGRLLKEEMKDLRKELRERESE